MPTLVVDMTPDSSIPESIIMNAENDFPAVDSSELMRHWFEMVSQTSEACHEWTKKQVSTESMHHTRSTIFKIWGEYWENIFRSSAFLNAEKQFMSGNLEYRKKIHEFLGQLHHEMQLATVPDIDQLVRTLRRMGEDQQEQQEQICQRLDKMAAQLDDLAKRLDAAENESLPEANSNPGPHSEGKPNHLKAKNTPRHK
jgi:uncharacterized coiled-coil protein SlyX